MGQALSDQLPGWRTFQDKESEVVRVIGEFEWPEESEATVICVQCDWQHWHLAKKALSVEFGFEVSLVKTLLRSKREDENIPLELSGFSFIYKGEGARRRAIENIDRLGLKWKDMNMRTVFEPWNPKVWVHTDGSVSFPDGTTPDA